MRSGWERLSGTDVAGRCPGAVCAKRCHTLSRWAVWAVGCSFFSAGQHTRYLNRGPTCPKAPDVPSERVLNADLLSPAGLLVRAEVPPAGPGPLGQRTAASHSLYPPSSARLLYPHRQSLNSALGSTSSGMASHPTGPAAAPIPGENLGSIDAPGERVGSIGRVTQHDPENTERFIRAGQG